LCKTFFEGDGDWDNRIAGGVCLDPLCDFREVLVFLPDVVFFAEVDEVDDGFGGEEEERIYYFNL